MPGWREGKWEETAREQDKGRERGEKGWDKGKTGGKETEGKGDKSSSRGWMNGWKKLHEIASLRKSNEHKKDLNSRCED